LRFCGKISEQVRSKVVLWCPTDQRQGSAEFFSTAKTV